MSFSLATMTALIGARVARKQQKARRAARRALVLPEMIHHIGGLTGELKLSGMEKDAVLMAEVVRDLAGLVIGRERTRLMEALQRLGVDDALRRLLKRGSSNHRVLAAEALALFPAVETYAALQRAQRQDSKRVRLAALRTLIELERPPSIEEMIDGVIGGDEHPSLLFSDLLNRAARTQIDGACVTLERTDLPAAIRVMVMQALGASGDELALRPLLAATHADDAEVRAGALAALATLGHPDIGPAVEAALIDKDWRVRLKAVECVRKLGLTDFFAAVMACAADDVWWVRYRAGQTLMSLADDDVAKLKIFAKDAVKLMRRPPTAGAEPALQLAAQAMGGVS
jgi:HEAT repeat protein